MDIEDPVKTEHSDETTNRTPPKMKHKLQKVDVDQL